MAHAFFLSFQLPLVNFHLAITVPLLCLQMSERQESSASRSFYQIHTHNLVGAQFVQAAWHRLLLRRASTAA